MIFVHPVRDPNRRFGTRLRRIVSNGARKSLGQNFLLDKNIITNIINSLSLSSDDVILEIGPGHGEITKALVGKACLAGRQAKKVFACEIDKRLALGLEKELSEYPNVEIINLDFLKLDLKNIFDKAQKKIKIFGNLPYYISSPIITHLFQNKEYIDSAYLTLQKEFVRRIISTTDSSAKGAFTFFVQYHSRPSLIFDISKNCFRPIPKVDSSFIKLEMKKSALDKDDEELFFKIIRRAFCQRRKSLKNSLKTLFSKEILLDESIFNFGLRPEQLSEDDFINLVKIYNTNKI